MDFLGSPPFPNSIFKWVGRVQHFELIRNPPLQIPLNAPGYARKVWRAGRRCLLGSGLLVEVLRLTGRKVAFQNPPVSFVMAVFSG